MSGESGRLSPIMHLVGGPQGSGKSTFFPVATSGQDSFNIDDERKRLNRDSSQRIPPEVQRAATKAYRKFIEDHISAKRSFSIEVTLGKDVTFEQAKRARAAGFSVRLTYVAAELKECAERMAGRIEAGGHGVPEKILRATHAASLKNLKRAIQEFDAVTVFDNSRRANTDEADERIAPALVLRVQDGEITFRARKLPPWLHRALKPGRRKRS